MAKKRITIAGYYGFKNVGDEAVLHSMLHDFRKTGESFDFVVLTNDPEETSNRYNVGTLHWHNYKEIIETIRTSDLLIVGGGGLYNVYQEYDPDKLLMGGHQLFSVIIIGLPILAHILGTKCMIFGVGASHIYSESAKIHIQKSFELADVATVRDSGSKDILISVGCSPEKILVTADPAFRLINSDNQTLNTVLQKENIQLPDLRIIGIVMRNWDYYGDRQATEDAIYDAIKKILDTEQYSILFIPFDDGQDVGEMSFDTVLINRMMKRLEGYSNVFAIRGFYSSDIFSSLIGLCDFTLAMRLHSVVFSLKNLVPCIGLVYDPKVKNMLLTADLGELALDLDGITGELLYDKLRYVIRNEEGFKEKISLKLEGIKDSGEINILNALSLINNDTLYKEVSDDCQKFLNKITAKFVIDANEHMEKSRKLQIVIDQNKRYLRGLIDQGHYNLAIVISKDMVQLEPRDPDFNYFYAIILHNLNMSHEETLYYYDQALQCGYDKFWVYYNRGALLLRLKKVSEAKSDLLNAYELNPSHQGVNQLLFRNKE